MSIVIVLASFGTSPQFLVGDALSVVSKLVVVGQIIDNLEQVDRWVVASGFRTRIGQKTLVVKFLHVLHSLLWGDAQLTRDELLGLNSVQREGTMARFLLLGDREHLGRLIFLYHLE